MILSFPSLRLSAIHLFDKYLLLFNGPFGIYQVKPYAEKKNKTQFSQLKNHFEIREYIFHTHISLINRYDYLCNHKDVVRSTTNCSEIKIANHQQFYAEILFIWFSVAENTEKKLPNHWNFGFFFHFFLVHFWIYIYIVRIYNFISNKNRSIQCNQLEYTFELLSIMYQNFFFLEISWNVSFVNVVYCG